MNGTLPSQLDSKIVPATGVVLPPGVPPEVGQFNVFNVANLIGSYRDRPLMAFDRRRHYKISLIRGRSRVEYADQAFDIGQRALFLATPRVPYRWLPTDLNQAGYFCIFTDEFLRPTKGEMVLEKLPMFQPGGYPVLEVSEADYVAIEAVFQRMSREMASDYAYKYDLLRACLLELIHRVQQLLPAPALAPAHTAAARLAARFAELLERQFPLDALQQPLPLRTAKDYAGALAVHVNHLNRVLKETTGHTTTALIGERLTQEAKILLRQTNWTVSEIADGLGFADVAHFCHFFKRQTGQVPGAFRE